MAPGSTLYTSFWAHPEPTAHVCLQISVCAYTGPTGVSGTRVALSFSGHLQGISGSLRLTVASNHCVCLRWADIFGPRVAMSFSIHPFKAHPELRSRYGHGRPSLRGPAWPRVGRLSAGSTGLPTGPAGPDMLTIACVFFFFLIGRRPGYRRYACRHAMASG
jgi:hypothetical protein